MSRLDLHCHWLLAPPQSVQLDDGVRTLADAYALLRGLRDLGFSLVCATPHLRPAMFPLSPNDLRAAYTHTIEALQREHGGVPLQNALAAEHFFDDLVAQTLLSGEGLPYPQPEGASSPPALLIELSPERFPLRLQQQLIRLSSNGYRIVLAHPERYRPVWEDDRCLDPLLDLGVMLLLDVCALDGKYGQTAERTARKLLDDGAYQAACTDAHRSRDVDSVARALVQLERAVGSTEAARLFDQGPREILSGPSR